MCYLKGCASPCACACGPKQAGSWQLNPSQSRGKSKRQAGGSKASWTYPVTSSCRDRVGGCWPNHRELLSWNHTWGTCVAMPPAGVPCGR